MDPFSLLLHVLAQFWWMWLLLVLLCLLGSLARSPSFKGWIGERRLARRLRLLPSERYHVIGNLTLPTADGSTQIDHVVVSCHGIFVIETKNYAGWIFGKANDKTWTQKLYKRSSSFQNPLRQNYKHLRTLAELAGVDEHKLFSLVVFVGSAEFRTAMPPNVVRLEGCLAAIREKTAALLEPDEVARVLARIRSGRLAQTLRTRAAHARHVQELVRERARERTQAGQRPHEEPATAPVAAPVSAATPAATVPAPQSAYRPACPRCGGTLDILTYKTGPKAGQAFQGCLRFPACSYRAELPAAAGEQAETAAP